MTNVYKLMGKIRAKDWFLDKRRMKLNRVDDSSIELQMPFIKGRALTSLQEMDEVKLELIGSGMGDKITIVLEVQ